MATTPRARNRFDDAGPVADEPDMRAPADSQGPITPTEAAGERRLTEALPEIRQQTTAPVGMAQQQLSYKDIADNARRQLESLGTTRDRVKGVDKYSPTETTPCWQSEEAMGMWNHVGPGCIVVMKRRHEVHPDERDDVADLKYRIPSAQVVTRKSDNVPFQDNDIIAVSVPIEYGYRLTVDEEDRLEDWQNAIKRETVHGSTTRKHPRFKERTEEEADHSRIRSRNMGIGTYATGTFQTPYRDLLTRMQRSPEFERETLALEAKNRRGGRHETYTEEQAEELDRSRTGGKKQTVFDMAGGKR
jgi:hypothetical protein